MHCNKEFYTNLNNYTLTNIQKRFQSVNFQICKCIYLHTMAGPATRHINPGVPSLQSGTTMRTHPVLLTRLLHGYLQTRHLLPADMSEERNIANMDIRRDCLACVYLMQTDTKYIKYW